MENKPSEKINVRVDLPRPTLLQATSLVFLAAIGLWVCALIAGILPPMEAMDLVTVTNLLYYLPFLCLPLVILCRKKPGLSDALRLNPMPVIPLFSVIFLALGATLFASALTGLWTGLLELLGFPMPPLGIEPKDSRELMLAVITAAAVPAVFEELLFRGVLMSAWETRGTKYAVIVSSLFFALIHGNIHGLPAYLLVGAMAGYIVFALDSIYAGMIFHTVYNTACLVITYLATNAPGAEQAALAAENADPFALLFSMILELALTGFMMLFSLFTLKLHRKLHGIEPVPRIRQPIPTAERVLILLSVIPMLGMILLNI